MCQPKDMVRDRHLEPKASTDPTSLNKKFLFEFSTTSEYAHEWLTSSEESTCAMRPPGIEKTSCWSLDASTISPPSVWASPSLDEDATVRVSLRTFTADRNGLKHTGDRDVSCRGREGQAEHLHQRFGRYCASISRYKEYVSAWCRI